MTIIKVDDGTIKIAKDFVTAAYLPTGSKCWRAHVSGRNFLVAAETLDNAQQMIIRALASEGIKSTGAGSYQVA